MTDSKEPLVVETRATAGRRFSAMTVDQAVAGASNVLVTILAARSLSPSGFGLFGIVFLTFVLSQSSARALVGEPLLVHPQEATRHPEAPLGSGLLLGLGLGALVALIGVAAKWGGALALGPALLILGSLLPLLVIQDLARYLAFTVHRPGRALALDSLWLVVMLPLTGLLLVHSTRSVALFVAAWLAPGAMAGVLALWWFRAPGTTLSATWLRRTWPFSWRYLLSFGASYGGTLIASLALSAIAGAAALGGVRGALLVVRPFSAFFIAAVAGSVTDIARQEFTGQQLRRRAFKVSVFVGGVALANGAVLFALPDVLGEALLGATWDLVKTLLLPAGVQILLMGMWAGARAGLVGVRDVRTTVRLDIAWVPVGVTASLIGAALAGGWGFYWGTVFGQLFVTCSWWIALWRRTNV